MTPIINVSSHLVNIDASFPWQLSALKYWVSPGLTVAVFTKSRSWKPSKELKKLLRSLQVKLKTQRDARTRARWLMLRAPPFVEWTSTNQKPTCYLATLTSNSYESTRANGMRYGQASLLNNAAGSRSSMAKTVHAALKSTALKDRLRRATIWLMGAIPQMLIRRWAFARGRMRTVRNLEITANGSLLRSLSKSASRVIKTCKRRNCNRLAFPNLLLVQFFPLSLRFKETLTTRDLG